MKLLYHGSSNSEQILQHGIDIDFPRRSDPGDFGWGFYLTGNLSRARVKGKVLDVLIDDSKYAFIRYPYFLKGLQTVPPETTEEQLFYDLVVDPKTNQLRTVSGPDREKTSKEVRRVFLSEGYQGIITPHAGIEAVVFDTASIKDLRPHK